MQFIKQGKDECYIATLAMLSGVDYNKILSDATAISPVIHNWSMFTNAANPDDITMSYRALARKYAPYLMDYCDPVSSYKIAEQRKFIGYAEYMEKTSLGRGAVLLASRYLSRPGAHIAAYETGVIYCPSQDGPMSARDYYIKCASKTTLCPYAIVSELGD